MIRTPSFACAAAIVAAALTGAATEKGTIFAGSVGGGFVFPRFVPAYDAIAIQGAQHVWIDRNTITDAPVTDDTLTIENGKIKQCHDGAIDITRGANYVSVTYNVFDRHDKTLLIGHSDSNTADIGRFKVTIANNVAAGAAFMTPLVILN